MRRRTVVGRVGVGDAGRVRRAPGQLIELGLVVVQQAQQCRAVRRHELGCRTAREHRPDRLVYVEVADGVQSGGAEVGGGQLRCGFVVLVAVAVLDSA